MNTVTFSTDHYSIVLDGTAANLWSYHSIHSAEVFQMEPPVFEINGVKTPVVLRSIRSTSEPRALSNGTCEYRFSGELQNMNHVFFDMVFRVAMDSPFLRFRYELHSDAGIQLTKSGGVDLLCYGGVSLQGLEVKEIQLSNFNETVHSFCLQERPISAHECQNETKRMGPIVVGLDDARSVLLAYEHGSQYPDAFLTYQFHPYGYVTLHAVKGNYYHGQVVGPDSPYSTIWFQFGFTDGDEQVLARHYRTFALRYMSQNQESRKPYIFYNTWAYQERNKWWNNRRFLDSMVEERILAEIDVAHRMGVEFFVLDTGWYETTGDWRVNRRRFTENLQRVKARLDGYGMKMGLWFGPTSAAVSSQAYQANRDYVLTWRGHVGEPQPVWETEESHHMCLVSPYGPYFAEELVRLVKDVGVTYFKWDAIHQYGCDAHNHDHGTTENTPEERSDCYAFQLGLSMSRIVDRVCEACPEAIVDFDITEGHRYVGLGFLASGKYFLINNGPYYHNYDIPIPDTEWTNIFVRPGPARSWICRTPLTFDKWIPSVLFLTHYLPDDPHDSQLINIASLILGQNGIWGDLLKVSEEGIQTFGQILDRYKQVRDDITQSSPVRLGETGGDLEVHEKVSSIGRGAVVVFSNTPGRYHYVTENTVCSEYWATEGVSIRFDSSGKALLDLTFDGPSAKIVLFGVDRVEPLHSKVRQTLTAK